MTQLLKQNDLYIRYHPWQRRDVDDAEPSVRSDVAYRYVAIKSRLHDLQPNQKITKFFKDNLLKI